MKTRFSSFDIASALAEISENGLGLRVNQVYDIDHKTYLLRLQKAEKKLVLLVESGIRIHLTEFEWPKNPAPSGFSMKLRKHLNNKRLEKVLQIGHDRIIDLQFGSNEAAYHIIVELYDKGNIALTDHEYVILNILRPRVEGENIRFFVRDKYCFERSMHNEELLLNHGEVLGNLLNEAKKEDTLKKLLVPKTNFGPAVIEHVLLESGLSPNSKLGTFSNLQALASQLHSALSLANELMSIAEKSPKGIVIQKLVKRSLPDGSMEDFYSNEEFHPMLFHQHTSAHYKVFQSFNSAVDEFFSKMESQKLDLKAIQQERDALKKLENIRQDHNKRLANLQKVQETDERKARLIELNQPIIDHAIKVVRSAVAAQMSWSDIDDLVEQGTRKGDPVAGLIKKLKLSTNQITLALSDPYEDPESDESGTQQSHLLVDIDLGLTAYANARKYFDEKKSASKKEQKTIESSMKAFKSAEKKTKQILKESAKIAVINKARKTHWFEKFYWFISSENYLVVGGRDRQQNELLVKRYLKQGDIYVHADLQGASSVIIKNQCSAEQVPPRTLQEAGIMAVGYSAAWEARVMTTAWWVNSSQVSKTAPSGEYLTTGSFMIRGKKNFLPAVPIVLGFGILFRLEDGSVFRHVNDRKPKAVNDEPAVEDLEHVDEEINCSSDSETEAQQLPGDLDEQLESFALEESVPFPDTVISQVPVPIAEFKTDQGGAADSEVYSICGEIVEKRSARSQSSAQWKKRENVHQEQKTDENKHQVEVSGNQKRGQKGKMKKIKEKYKDQDEDERELRMRLLQSSGAAKEKGKSKKKSGKQQGSSEKSSSSKQKSTLQREVIVAGNEVQEVRKEKESEELLPATVAFLMVEDTDAIEGDANPIETDLLGSFTGIPMSEDELLYAMPVVAPYSTLTPYKFKVKVTPGQTKRGKAAKTALSVYLQDKSMTNRERDLIKSIKDQDLGRNLPGRVKLSIPQAVRRK